MALHSRFNVLSLCSGIGSLDQAIRLAVPAARTVLYVEREIAAVEILVRKIAKGVVDDAPIWSDIASFKGQSFCGCVDAVIAGLPCQPYSLAGPGRGNADERAFGADSGGPVPHALRIIGECRPAMVYFENVSAWVTAGHFRGVGEELSRLGYTLENPLFLRASDIGAPHKRERVFILAHRGDLGRFGVCLADSEPAERGRQTTGRGQGRRTALGGTGGAMADGGREYSAGRGIPGNMAGTPGEVEGDGEQRQRLRDAAGDGGEPVRDPGPSCAVGVVQDNADGAGRGEHRRSESAGAEHAAAECSESVVGDAAIIGRQEGRPEHGLRSGLDTATDAGSSLPLFPPGRGRWEHVPDPDHPGRYFAVPLDRDAAEWCAVLEREPDLAPAVEHEVCGLANGSPGPGRIDTLRGLGNSVVPTCAALAFLILSERATTSVATD